MESPKIENTAYTKITFFRHQTSLELSEQIKQIPLLSDEDNDEQNDPEEDIHQYDKLVENCFSMIGKFSITRDDYKSLLKFKCWNLMRSVKLKLIKEEKKEYLFKVLKYIRECTLDMEEFDKGYHYMAVAFVEFNKLGNADKIIDDEEERQFMKKSQIIGKLVIDCLRKELESNELSKKNKLIIHNLIEHCLSNIFWFSYDGYENEENLSGEETKNRIMGYQRHFQQGGEEILKRKVKRFLENFHARSSTHLKSKTYTLVIKLLHFRPCIWRRFIVPGSITLSSLHDRVIAPIMGWCRNYHAYFFRKIPFENVKMERPGIPGLSIVFGPVNSSAVDRAHEIQSGVHIVDDSGIQLYQILEKEGDEMIYVYDLGDTYTHKIYVEKIDDSNDRISVEDGDHLCPLEDCGSTMDYVKIAGGLLYGPYLDQNKDYINKWMGYAKKRTYEDMVLVSKKAANVQHKKGNFDPLDFSIVECKRRLQNALRSEPSDMDHSNFHHYIGVKDLGYFELDGKFEETKLLVKKIKKECAGCKLKENLKQCSNCRSVFYCSQAHQAQDWKNHKAVCGREIK